VCHMDVAQVDRDIAYCCNGCTLTLQAFVLNVSYVSSDVCCKCVYLDVAYVSHICLQVFYLDVTCVFAMASSIFRCFYKCFRCMFQVFHVPSDVYCKCYI
jgi:hypothetical protein